MKKIFVALQLLILQSVMGQMILSPVVNNNVSVPVLTQVEIDKMEQPGEGYVVLNKTTGCINYFINNTWYQQCGNCLPETKNYTIDSVLQKGASLEVYFTKASEDTLFLKADEMEVNVFQASGPAVFRLRATADSLKLYSYVSNKCYPRQREKVMTVALQKVQVSAPQKATIEGKTVTVRNINGTIWMCNDWLASPAGKPLSQRLLSYSDATCPAGWKVPAKKDWTQLLNFYTNRTAEVFDTARADNISVSLNKLGAYAVQEKKMIGESAMGSYWVSEQASNGNQYLVNVTDYGYMFVSEKKEIARLNLRCIRYE